MAREERASRGVEWGPEEPERISGMPNGGASAKPRRGTSGGGGAESGDVGGRRKGFGDLFVKIEKFRGLSEN